DYSRPRSSTTNASIPRSETSHHSSTSRTTTIQHMATRNPPQPNQILHPSQAASTEEREALVSGEDGRALGALKVDGGQDLEGVRVEAASGGGVQALQRPAVHREGLRHRRVVSEPAGVSGRAE